MIHENLQNYFNYLSLFISVMSHGVFMEAALHGYHSITYENCCFLTCILIFTLSVVGFFVGLAQAIMLKTVKQRLGGVFCVFNTCSHQVNVLSMIKFNGL